VGAPTRYRKNGREKAKPLLQEKAQRRTPPGAKVADSIGLLIKGGKRVKERGTGQRRRFKTAT